MRYYVVYVNHPTNKARIHTTKCAWYTSRKADKQVMESGLVFLQILMMQGDMRNQPASEILPSACAVAVRIPYDCGPNNIHSNFFITTEGYSEF
jgi:hypothetical protein